MPRHCRSDAADFSGIAAEYGLVHRLPPQSGSGVAAPRSGIQHGMEGAGQSGRIGRAVRARTQNPFNGGSDKLLHVSPIARTQRSEGYRFFAVVVATSKRKELS